MDALTPDQKGNIAEACVAAHAIRLGIEVYRPVGEGGRFDMVFLFPNGELSRVQCKWAARANEVVVLRAQTSRRTANGFLNRGYSAREIDAFAAYCAERDQVYYVPIEVLDGQRLLHLRLAPAKNGQRGAIHWAADYELGAVAQLARAPAWHAGGQGFESPQLHSSVPAQPMTIGSDDFRNRLGWYCDRAAGGEEFLVTRRGRPRFRVVPV